MNVGLSDSFFVAESSFFGRLFEEFEGIRAGRFDPEAAALRGRRVSERRMGREERRCRSPCRLADIEEGSRCESEVLGGIHRVRGSGAAGREDVVLFDFANVHTDDGEGG